MLENRWKKLIKKAVYRYVAADSCEVFLFGSRATGENRKWSDVDVGILSKTSLPSGALVQIESDLDESDIPYQVDVVDFLKVSPGFAEIALEKTEKL